ncbi:MAG TPA: class I SAM-dependent methyltransferase [Candidatus Limnocylindrales bacterium]|nr:class I SAM-dependent methyltransferase [Candidatus Limnocylindrales bacterium]
MISPQVAGVLDRLHRQARGDWLKLPKVLPRAVYAMVTGRSMMRTVTPAMLKNVYIPVSRNDGWLLHALARGTDARRIVEFGASFGISTLYLAEAVRANGGGQVITTEIEASKCRAAEANIREAGLEGVATVLEGDALETLKDVDGPIDLLFLDGWKDLYVPVLDLIAPKLRPGAVIMADNVNMPDTKPYLERVRGDSRFVSALLPGGRMECSWVLAA